MLLAATHEAALTKNVVNRALRARQLLRKVAAIRGSENPLPGETAALEALDHVDPGHRFTTALATSYGNDEGGIGDEAGWLADWDRKGGLQRWVKTTLVKWKAEGVPVPVPDGQPNGKAKGNENSKAHDGDVVAADAVVSADAALVAPVPSGPGAASYLSVVHTAGGQPAHTTSVHPDQPTSGAPAAVTPTSAARDNAPLPAELSIPERPRLRPSTLAGIPPAPMIIPPAAAETGELSAGGRGRIRTGTAIDADSPGSADGSSRRLTAESLATLDRATAAAEVGGTQPPGGRRGRRGLIAAGLWAKQPRRWT